MLTKRIVYYLGLPRLAGLSVELCKVGVALELGVERKENVEGLYEGSGSVPPPPPECTGMSSSEHTTLAYSSVLMSMSAVGRGTCRANRGDAQKESGVRGEAARLERGEKWR